MMNLWCRLLRTCHLWHDVHQCVNACKYTQSILLYKTISTYLLTLQLCCYYVTVCICWEVFPCFLSKTINVCLELSQLAVTQATPSMPHHVTDTCPSAVTQATPSMPHHVTDTSVGRHASDTVNATSRHRHVSRPSLKRDRLFTVCVCACMIQQTYYYESSCCLLLKLTVIHNKFELTKTVQHHA